MLTKSTSVVILAAGNGTRFSSDGIKKQFVEILDEPLLLRTCRIFDPLPYVREIIVMTAEEDIEKSFLILNGRIRKLSCVKAGGKTRRESAFKSLDFISEKSSLIAIHDCARCLTDPDAVNRTIEAADKYGAAACAEKAVDTVKIVDSKSIIVRTVDREEVMLVKTPQVFRKNVYLASALMAQKDGADVTDDCMLAERAGFKVKLIDCGHDNIKITYPEDKIIAEAILEGRK